MEQNLENQTQFAAQEALLSDQSDHALEMASSRLPMSEADKKKQRHKILIIIGVIILLFLSLVLYLVNNNKKLEVKNIFNTESKLTGKKTTQFDKEIAEINTDLQAADPSVNDFPFPPVDLNASLFVLEEN